jgi:hypothetical protein
MRSLVGLLELSSEARSRQTGRDLPRLTLA